MVTYGYNAINQLTSAATTGIGSTGYEYDAAGQLKTVTRPNGVTTAYHYFDNGWLQDIIHSSGAATLASYQYQYDNVGNRVQAIENILLPSQPATPTPTPVTSPTHTPTNTPVGPTATFTATSTNTPTATPTATQSASDLIFADGFESGNLTAWTSSTTDAGDLSVTAAAALKGNQGMQAVIDDNNTIYVTDDSPNAEPRYRARFYFDPNSITMASGDAHFIFKGFMGTSTEVLRVEFRQSSGTYQIRAALVNDGTAWTNTNWFTMSDASHSIELDWQAATGAGANNGSLTLWIDGTQQPSLSGVDNDTRRIDRVRLGALTGVDTGTRGTYYFDAFESRRTSYIGLLALVPSFQFASYKFAPLQQGGTYSKQPDPTEGLDTYLLSTSPTTNNGTDLILAAGESNNAMNRVTRALIKFDLSSIPSNAIITSATLSLWTTGDLSDNTRTIRVYRLKRAFNESEATWERASAGVTWEGVGASGANDRESVDIGSVQILASEPLNTEKQISLTPAQIEEMTSGAFTNHGFIIVADTELNDRFNYKSSDAANGMQRPKLVIQYSTSSATATPTPEATATQTPTPTATSVATATPTPTQILATNTPTATSIPSGPITINYVYDPLYRLEEANYSTGDYYHYTYDPVGNRLSQQSMVGGLSSTVAYLYDDANRLKFVNAVEHMWDDNGNLLSDGVNTYVYDSANRLTSISGGQIASFAYNGLGDRLSQNGVNYTLDLNAGLTQVLNDGTNQYLYGVGRIAQVNTTTEYFLGDALGSVRQMTTASAQITFARAYDPYGTTAQTAGASHTAYGFTGEFTDPSGLIYLRARYYASGMGRFLTKDTWRGNSNRPMSFNKWMYVEGNPINRVDPSGMCYTNRNIFSSGYWARFWESPILGPCSSSTGQSNVPATPTILPTATYTPTCTPTIIPTITPTLTLVPTPPTGDLSLDDIKILSVIIAFESSNGRVPDDVSYMKAWTLLNIRSYHQAHGYNYRPLENWKHHQRDMFTAKNIGGSYENQYNALLGWYTSYSTKGEEHTGMSVQRFAEIEATTRRAVQSWALYGSKTSLRSSADVVHGATSFTDTAGLCFPSGQCRKSPNRDDKSGYEEFGEMPNYLQISMDYTRIEEWRRSIYPNSSNIYSVTIAPQYNNAPVWTFTNFSLPYNPPWPNP
jgi:RHS repeat-associated protein